MKKNLMPARGSPEYIRLQLLLATKETLTTTEAAIFLELSPHTIYKLTAQKAFPFSKPGGKKIKIKIEDLKEWLTNNTINNNKHSTTRVNNYFLK